MNLTRFDITLILRAPVLSAAQGGRRFGLDSAMYRDWEGRPAISGALVRGNLRHAWRELADHGLAISVNDWLGKVAPDEEYSTGLKKVNDYPKGKAENEEKRSRLSFSHWFSASRADDRQTVRHRIQLNDQGVVAHGALQVIESPFHTGEAVELFGQAWALLREDENPEELARCMRKGLMWVPALGALKGVGFGKVENVEISHCGEPKNALPQIPGDCIGIVLEFDRPICFARPQTGKSENNLFESECFVPGAAIIAVLAARWPQNIKDQLDKLRITHALPAKKDNLRRPVAVPCSLAYVGKKLRDLVGVDGPLVDGSTPDFQPDWKGGQWMEVLELCGWPSLDRILETRTAIEFRKNTAAENQLFSTESIDTRDHVWLANIELSGIDAEKRDEVIKTLWALFADGLWPLGKTDARANIAVSESFGFTAKSGTPEGIDGEVVLTLVTATELLAPIPRAEDIVGPESWRMAYDQVFRRFSENALSVVRQFTRERLAGGNYLHHRFGNGGQYTPRLLTEAGSVFVLKVMDRDKAEKHLGDWLAQGLPCAAGEDWRISPYRPQNGYGEIVIDVRLFKGGAS